MYKIPQRINLVGQVTFETAREEVKKIAMTNFAVTLLLSTFCQTPKSTSIDFAYWKWVVLVGVAAVVVFYVLKRVSDIVVDRKTDKLIRDIEKDDDSPSETTKGSD